MAKRTPIPFREIAQQALGFAESLLPKWIGGKRVSGEWQAEHRASGGLGDSLTVNLTTGKWMHGSADKDGGDLVSLYAYVFGVKMNEAAIEVADQIGFKLPEGCIADGEAPKERSKPVVDPSTYKPAKEKEESPWHPITPVPAEAPEAPLAHPRRGLPVHKWAYLDADGQLLGYVYRFNTSDGGKEHVPLTYCKNQKTGKFDWRWMQWTQPSRPLYGLDQLAAKPDAYVLLVEGEKCKDAAQAEIAGVAVTWSGGAKAVDKMDWSPLAGRKVIAWPDCDAQHKKQSKEEQESGAPLELLPENDQPGVKAMLKIRDKLLALDPATQFLMVDIPKPGEKPDGWDCADAIADGIAGEKFTSFINNTRAFLSEIDGSEKQQSTPNSANAGEGEKEELTWVDYLLRKQGSIVPCLANVVDIIENDKRWEGIIAYDEFAQRVLKLKKPPFWNNAGEAGEWDAQDDARCAMWLTKVWRFSPSPALVAEAIEVVARNHTINPPKEWLESLRWDGSKRLDTWLTDFLGVDVSEYSKRVGRWFFMGMVKRVFQPGCKFDYCLVLEGSQGFKKSTALAIIGGDWFGDTDLDLHNKDSMSALRGKMLYEFSELGSLAKAEATKQKSFLSRQFDEYRPVYGRREIRAPRQLVFAGTTNEWEWNKDPTGGRRFWPVEVMQQIDVDGLREVRDQLFAEAVARVNKGQRYWPEQQEQAKIFDPEQLKRAIQESFVDALAGKVNEMNSDFSLYYAATVMMGMDAAKISRDIQVRIGNALRQLGCTRFEKRNDQQSRFWYKPPERKLASSMNLSTEEGEDDEITFL